MNEDQNPRPGTGGLGNRAVVGQPSVTVNVAIHSLAVNIGAYPPARPFNPHLSLAMDALTALVDEVPGLRLPLRPLKRALEDAAFAAEVAA